MSTWRPKDATETAAIVTEAVAAGTALEIVGGGSKRTLGRPSAAAHVLDLAALRGIVDYEPAELVLTAQAATPMEEIEAALAANNQILAFEPPDWRALLGPAGVPTLGGVLACNLSGPRRVRAGAARDHLLGFAAVNGFGEAWKAGGRVVKNVTGYDMCKLQAGAFGTLSVLTELSFKVLPRPETSCSLVWPGLSDAAAIGRLATALNSPHEVSGAAHLPAAAAARSTAGQGAGAAVTVVRLEGPRVSVDHRAAALAAALGAALRLDEPESRALWREIAAVQPLLGRQDTIVWRVCPTPSAAPELLAQVQARGGVVDAFFDWGGGLLWLALDPTAADAGAAVVRGALAASGGGHATLVRASAAIRAAVPVFEPAAPALEALSRRVKASFDPRHILNPGRMVEGR